MTSPGFRTTLRPSASISREPSSVCKMAGIAAVCSLRSSPVSKLKRTSRTPSACMTVRETVAPSLT
jgi:hypothetical protein